MTKTTNAARTNLRRRMREALVEAPCPSAEGLLARRFYAQPTPGAAPARVTELALLRARP